MGYVQEARENHVKKKVEEDNIGLRKKYHPLGPWVILVPFACFECVYGTCHKMKQKALKECDQYVAKYAECAQGRTLSVVWQCREQAKVLNKCLHQFTNDSVLEQMKKEYMHQEEERGNASTSFSSC